jgi:Concanavalin A-like lectin/glucanases superfamily/Divergent InlB B-repeat domain/Putative Ig domain/Immunoglobulin I-set domain
MKYSHDFSGNMANRAPVAVSVPPQIKGQPANQIAAPGEIVTFSVVVADARAVTFQWKFNGTDILGATGDSLLLTNVNTANEGQYSVLVTNSAGSVTSAPAALMLDSDRDGLPDSWEIAHFTDPNPTHPLNPANQRGETDPDKDGISNLDEFLDGTDPTNKGSLRPRLTAYSDAGGSVTVTPMKLSYDLGESVTLTPLPFPLSVFVGWAGDLSGTVNPATLTMDRNKTVRARFASAVPLTLPAGLIAIWRGETDASDLIGGHHGTFFAGTVVTAPSVTASGKVGGAFNFDGTVHVGVPDSAALRPAQLTVEAWVFLPARQVGLRAIIARGSSATDYRKDFNTWCLRLRDSMPDFVSHDQGRMEAGFEIPPNEWTHLAITFAFDGLAVKRLYVNGAKVAEIKESKAAYYLGPLVYYDTPVTIGSDWAGNVSSDHFIGRIDEVALYDRVLTADKIRSIYNADSVGKNFSHPYFPLPPQLPDALLGASYTEQVVAILGTIPISFTLSAGMLPPGMTLSSAGLVSGVPSGSGTFGFTARATDAAGAFTEQPCVLRVCASVTAPAGLVGWWRAENNAQDSVGTNHGVLRNGAGFAAGKVDQAFELDGTDDCIEIPDAPALRPGSLTLEAWVAFDVTSGRQVVFAKPRGTLPFDGASYELYLDGGRNGDIRAAAQGKHYQ